MTSFVQKFLFKPKIFKETQKLLQITATRKQINFFPKTRSPISISKLSPQIALQLNNYTIKIKNSYLINSLGRKPINVNAIKVRNFTNEVKVDPPKPEPPKQSIPNPEVEKSLGIFKRFQLAYKQHGKVLIYTHIFTSIGWIVSFFILSNKLAFKITVIA